MRDSDKPGAGIKGTRVGGDPQDEGEHFMVCPVCDERFDMRELGEAFAHWHDGPEPKKPH